MPFSVARVINDQHNFKFSMFPKSAISALSLIDFARAMLSENDCNDWALSQIPYLGNGWQ